jgi:uncharacterized protein (TIGR00251 family)
MSPWYRVDPHARRITLTVHVQPDARATAVAGLHGDALKVRVAAPATDNRANAALLAHLQAVLGLPAARIRLRSGVRGRRKLVQIEDVDDVLLARLDRLTAGA